MGGLGNQLFQMATCIGYAKSHGIDYCIPKHTLNDSVWKPYFFENIKYCDKELVGEVFREIGHLFIEIPHYEERNIILYGYFQTEKYFINDKKLLRQLFGFDTLQTKYDRCAIHIRRSDYLKYPTKHPVITNDYLREAQNVMLSNAVFDFIVFSDDIEWAENEMMRFDAANYTFIENGDAIKDLKLYSSCQHHIISNSTYSWWGAWLSFNHNSITITPHEDNWFGLGNKHLDVSDLIPKNWLKIKY